MHLSFCGWELCSVRVCILRLLQFDPRTLFPCLFPSSCHIVSKISGAPAQAGCLVEKAVQLGCSVHLIIKHFTWS